MIETAMHTVVDSWISALNASNLSSFRPLCASNITVHAVSLANNSDDGLDRIETLLQAYRAGFPDAHFSAGESTLDGDFVRGEWSARGTNLLPFLGQPATGKKVTIRGSYRFRLVDGLVRENWFDFDLYDLLEQIDAFCASPGTAWPSSLATCEHAIGQWTQALAGREVSFETSFSDAVIVHGYCFRLRTTEVGHDALHKLLNLVHAVLPQPEVSIRKRISQGNTTTYRGNISAGPAVVSGTETFLLDCICRTNLQTVEEIWIRIGKQI